MKKTFYRFLSIFFRRRKMAKKDTSIIPSPVIERDTLSTDGETRLTSLTKSSDEQSSQIKYRGVIPSFTLWLEKVDGKGEDAEPLLETRGSTGVLGVFDGMGGGGSSTYSGKDGKTYSGAYYASRLARKAVFDAWNLLPQKDINVLFDKVENILIANFRQLGTKFSPSSSTLIGNTLKRFPTTIAVLAWSKLTPSEQKSLFGKRQQSSNAFQAKFVWAGDSRCYLLQALNGLRQITRDDTVIKSDALSSIYNDPPLSKSVNADELISINRETILIDSPSILFACTDGCYNYVETPMHFEFVLLSTMMASSSIEEWQDKLFSEVSNFTGDDASLALACIGWENFDDVKASFRNRHGFLKKSCIDLLWFHRQKIENLEHQIKNALSEYEEIKLGQWNLYKETYQGYEENV